MDYFSVVTQATVTVTGVSGTIDRDRGEKSDFKPPGFSDKN